MCVCVCATTGVNIVHKCEREREGEVGRVREAERERVSKVKGLKCRRAVSDVENFHSSGNCIPPLFLLLFLHPSPSLLLALPSLADDPISISNRTPRPAQLTLSPLSFVTGSCCLLLLLLTYHAPAPLLPCLLLPPSLLLSSSLLCSHVS